MLSAGPFFGSFFLTTLRIRTHGAFVDDEQLNPLCFPAGKSGPFVHWPVEVS
jgi:hypothetical protein